MINNKFYEEIARLKFENYIWLVFIALAIMNIVGDYLEVDYLNTNNKFYKNKANNIFDVILIITFLIYIYFFIRNYDAYQNASVAKQKLMAIKLLGSCFFIAGVLCLLYFQINQKDFIGTPAI